MCCYPSVGRSMTKSTGTTSVLRSVSPSTNIENSDWRKENKQRDGCRCNPTTVCLLVSHRGTLASLEGARLTVCVCRSVYLADVIAAPSSRTGDLQRSGRAGHSSSSLAMQGQLNLCARRLVARPRRTADGNSSASASSSSHIRFIRESWRAPSKPPAKGHGDEKFTL